MKVLFILQELTPYVEETLLSRLGRILPQAVQESGCEIRTFMPRWGTINERRNQLHEVIRLSGMNIIVDDTDNPLIIKVASIQAARMQVYFIDNDTYFHHRRLFHDDEGKAYDDNTERAIFFARGVLETVKKLRWIPDVIYCQGWMGSLAPLYIKTAYHDEPYFSDARVIYATGGTYSPLPAIDDFGRCLYIREAAEAAEALLTEHEGEAFGLGHLAVHYADNVVQINPDEQNDVMDYARAQGKPVLILPKDDDETAIAQQLALIKQ